MSASSNNILILHTLESNSSSFYSLYFLQNTSLSPPPPEEKRQRNFMNIFSPTREKKIEDLLSAETKAGIKRPHSEILRESSLSPFGEDEATPSG